MSTSKYLIVYNLKSFLVHSCTYSLDISDLYVTALYTRKLLVLAGCGQNNSFSSQKQKKN